MTRPCTFDPITRRTPAAFAAAGFAAGLAAFLRAVVAPLHVSTTFLRDPDNGYSSGFSYARPDNATVREAEAVLAMLEGAQAGAMLFGSGMAAATAIFGALEPGDHVVAPRVMYWALRRWLDRPSAATQTSQPVRGTSRIHAPTTQKAMLRALPKGMSSARMKRESEGK